ncbi:MAG: fibronectin type III domain-containing protein [bacterium]
MRIITTLLSLLLGINSLFSQWDQIIDVHHPIRNKQDIVRVWTPPSATKVKAFYLSGGIGNAKSFAESWSLRSHLEASDMGIVYIRTNYFGMGIFDHNKDSAFFWHVLDTVAKVTGIEEYKFAPWVVFGHSTDGLMAQNISLWKPERTLGIIYYKSGNLGNPANMKEPYKSLEPMKEIPFLAVNGRYEEFGPNGPFPGCSSPYPDSCHKEVQWLAMRDTLLQLREKGYRVSMAVDHYGDADHNSWTYHSFDLMGAFTEAAAKTQLNSEFPTSAPIEINRISEENGILGDSALSYLMDIGYYSFPTEALYTFFNSSDVQHKFWMPNRIFTEEWVEFHTTNTYEIPGQPGDPVLNQLPGKIVLEWTHGSPIGLDYIIQKKTENGDFFNLDTISSSLNSYTDNSVTQGTNYSYRVYSVNTDGVSSFSNEISTLFTGIDPVIKEKIEIFIENDFLFIISNEAITEVSIIDITGNSLRSLNTGEKNIKIPVYDLKTGIYILKTETYNAEYSNKILITK